MIRGEYFSDTRRDDPAHPWKGNLRAIEATRITGNLYNHQDRLFLSSLFPDDAPLQPPLQFYLHVLASKNWDQVDILTMAKEEYMINPTFKALEMMANTGVLGRNVRTHKVRKQIRAFSVAVGCVSNHRTFNVMRRTLQYGLFAVYV